MQKEKSINILVSYDQCMVAEGLDAILSKHKQFCLSSLRKNNINLHQTISLEQHDLLITEFSNISKLSVDYLIQLHKSLPKLKILVVSDMPPHEFLKSIMNSIDGYLIRSCSSEKLILAIEEIMANGKYICSQLIPVLFEENLQNNHQIELTLREKDILSQLFIAKDNLEIAETLNISQTTVRTHLKNIRNKFGDINQVQMMHYACNKSLHKDNCMPLCPNCKFFCKKANN
jgi:DNA-binding NarL/FixJ family response regulator